MKANDPCTHAACPLKWGQCATAGGRTERFTDCPANESLDAARAEGGAGEGLAAGSHQPVVQQPRAEHNSPETGDVEGLVAWIAKLRDQKTATCLADYEERCELAHDIEAQARLLEERTRERDDALGQIAAIREQFFSLIADARRWDEQVDGDADEYGRPIVTVDYFAEFTHATVADFIETLGVKRAFDETAGDALSRAMEATDAPQA